MNRRIQGVCGSWHLPVVDEIQCIKGRNDSPALFGSALGRGWAKCGRQKAILPLIGGLVRIPCSNQGNNCAHVSRRIRGGGSLRCEHAVTVCKESRRNLRTGCSDFYVGSMDDGLAGVTLRIDRGNGQGLGISRGEAHRSVLRSRLGLFDIACRGHDQRTLGVRVLGGCAQGNIVRGQGLRDDDDANSLIRSPTNTVGCSRGCRSFTRALAVIGIIDIHTDRDNGCPRGEADDTRT